VATLVRTLPVRVVEVSRSGCRLESAARLEPGLSGQLTIELQGLARIDDIRVTRCQQRMGGSPCYHVGAELLKTRRLGRRSVRLAVRKIIGEQTRGHGDASGNPAEPGTQPAWAGEADLRTEGRAPPSLPDRGS
jgi:hypothetical protein